jgi:phosphonate transport system substrate-binding protein
MDTSSLIGSRLGKYEIHAEIGRGGMGAVYKGYDPMLDSWVAVKVLAPHLLWEEEFVERFIREARTARKLKHPNIVTIYDVGQEAGLYYIVMEYLEGQTLTQEIRRRGPMPLQEVLQILRPLAEALDYAHHRGLVHRDIKPSNIIVDLEGRVTLTDFGVARAVEGTRLTTAGTVLGTPEYMSPEQAQGSGGDPRSDQYSLGVVVYEMLAGKVPFEADSPLALLYKAVHEPLLPISQARPDLPVGVGAVLNRALAKQPGDRYPTVTAFADALIRTQEGGQVAGSATRLEVLAPPVRTATKVMPDVRPAAPVRRRVPVWAWALGGLAVLALAAAVVISGVGQRAADITPMTMVAATRATSLLRSTATSGAEATMVATPLPMPSSWGTEKTPIVWSFVPSGDAERVMDGAEAVAGLLHDETGLYFETDLATKYTDVVEAMCSDPAGAHMGSLTTSAYVLAADRGCAEATLVSVRYGSSIYSGQIIARADSGIHGISDLRGKTFCRPDPLSASGWIVPMLTMRSAGINPETDLAEVVDAGNHGAVVTAVYNGDCDAGAVYVDARSQIEEDHPDVMDQVIVIHVTVDIPNDGVQFVPSVPQGVRDRIVLGLLTIAETEEGQRALETAYGWNSLAECDDAFYDPVRQVLQASGLGAGELMDW